MRWARKQTYAGLREPTPRPGGAKVRLALQDWPRDSSRVARGGTGQGWAEMGKGKMENGRACGRPGQGRWDGVRIWPLGQILTYIPGPGGPDSALGVVTPMLVVQLQVAIRAAV